MGRTAVRKTPKLFIGGEFVRSESGRTYPVGDVNVVRASRKDVRDAVVAARRAFPGWAARTPANRGQILYRVAEILEERRAQFPPDEVDDAIDRWVWYAGWADKVAQVAGSSNPVAGRYFDFTVPEPTGVVAVLAPPDSPLLGLASVLGPVVVTGNTVVVVASERHPLEAVTLAEVLATSDVPGGVVNLLTGRTAELAPVLAAHMDVDGIDLTGAPDGLAADLERSAAENVKRVRRPGPEDLHGDPGTGRLLEFVELKTVWHPIGT